jgi:hypothetical protein
MFYFLVTKVITFPETEHIFQRIFAIVADYSANYNKGHSGRRQK